MTQKISPFFAAALFAVTFLTGSAFAAQSVPVDVKSNGDIHKGTLFLPDQSKEPLPLIIVAPEWWGKNEYPDMRAKRIADELGYAALVVDIYGNDKVVEKPEDAQALATPFYQNPIKGVDILKAYIQAAPKAAKDANASIDMSKIIAIGYCFGGTQVLNLARADGLPKGENLVGVVSFHGGLESSLTAKHSKAKILVLTGEADKLVPEKQVNAFKDEMKKVNNDVQVVGYPGAMHAFTNRKATEIGKKYGIPVAYDAKADRDSWKRFKEFSEKLLK